MLHRISYRLKYIASSLIFGGVILLIFMKEWRLWSILIIIGGIFLYLFSAWLVKKTTPRRKYEMDEKGNAKPNYR